MTEYYHANYSQQQQQYGDPQQQYGGNSSQQQQLMGNYPQQQHVEPPPSVGDSGDNKGGRTYVANSGWRSGAEEGGQDERFSGFSDKVFYTSISYTFHG